MNRKTLPQRMSEVMLTKLEENHHKGHWRGCSSGYLLGRLYEEVGELYESISTEDGCHWGEAADVANLAAMIADNADGRG